MRIIVVGAGTVGSNIAKFLTRENHEVIIVDKEPQKLAQVEDELDVQTLVGDACDPVTLKSIEIESADLCIAVTEKDEVNLICAFAAKRMKAGRVIARVRSQYFYDKEEVNFQNPLDIDLLISPEILGAYELAQFIGTPGALLQVSLARGQVQLRTLKLAEKSTYVGHQVKDLNIPEGVLIAGIRRGDEVMIARGDTRLEADDRVTLIGLPNVLDRASQPITLVEGGERVASVAIAGAGETGIYLAQLLERRGQKVTLLEISRERAELAGEILQGVRVLHVDATDLNILREEGIGLVDYYIATMGDDENNVMSSLLAKELGVPKTACLIDRPDYTRIVEKIGIDIAISPRIVVANRVLRMVKRGRIRSVTLLEEGELEINEYQALSQSAIVGHPLMEIAPQGVLIGAIVQGGEARIPRGNDIIRPGTIVIGLAKADDAEKLDNLFAPVVEE